VLRPCRRSNHQATLSSADFSWVVLKLVYFPVHCIFLPVGIRKKKLVCLFPNQVSLKLWGFRIDWVIGKRFCIFYTSGCVSPALGGIMAGAVISGLDGARGWPGWRFV
jgi:hypothetical protein